MPKQISSLSISNFRSFGELQVSNLGGVNLITGKNNVGKSSFLEAVRLLISDGIPSVFHTILNYREEADGRQDDNSAAFSPDDYSAFCSLFTNYPTVAECKKPFSMSADHDEVLKYKLTVRMRWFAEKLLDDGSRRLVPADSDLFGESSGFPALEIENINRKRVMRIDRVLRCFRWNGFAREQG